jgi:hypothetical protein
VVKLRFLSRLISLSMSELYSSFLFENLFSLFVVILEFEPSPSGKLDKWYTTDAHHQPSECGLLAY